MACARIVAERQEEGHLIRDDLAVDAGIDLVDTGDGRQALLKLGIQAAVRHVEGVGLRNSRSLLSPTTEPYFLIMPCASAPRLTTVATPMAMPSRVRRLRMGRRMRFFRIIGRVP